MHRVIPKLTNRQLDQMKNLFLAVLLLKLCIISAYSQSNFDRNLYEKELNLEKGSKYIRKAIDYGKQALSQKDEQNAVFFLKKAYDKTKSIGQDEGTAVVALEISTLLKNAYPTVKKTSEFSVDMLENAVSQTKDAKILARTYEIALFYESINDPKLQKKANKVVLNTKSAHDKVMQQKKEEEEYQEKLRLEASTVRIEKEALKDLTTTVTKLNDVKEFLSDKMQQNEQVIRNMSKENLVKEAILEKNQRLIDSISFEAAIDSIIMDANNFELQKKDSELKLKESQRNLFLALAGLVLLISGFLYYRFSLARSYNKQLEEKNAIIEHEKHRSDELLLNILPEEVANELKTSGKVAAQQYSIATILFADFVNFSQISRTLTPQELIRDLDYCFSKFDAITGIHGVEKIKTIGDAYMVVAGVPAIMENHAEAAVNTAIGFINMLQEWNKERLKKNQLPFNIRVGLHSGPVCAGVVGTKKFVFDVWGDAVNIASRMESSAEPGRINISESTYHLIKNKFKCEPRGAIVTKNMGELKMYYIV